MRDVPDGKAVKPPSNLHWLNMSQLQVLTGVAARMVKEVCEQNNIPQQRANAKTIEYGSREALKAIYLRKLGVSSGEEGDQKVELKEAETNLKIEQAKNYKLKNDLLEGTVVEVEGLIIHWTDMTSKMKAKIRSLPIRIAQECVGIDDMKKIQNRCDEICDEAMQELSGELLPTVEEDFYDDDDTADQDNDSSSAVGKTTPEANS